jgi:hypothetical protein
VRNPRPRELALDPTDKAVFLDNCRRLVEETRLRTAPPPAKLAVLCALEPRWPQTALHRLERPVCAPVPQAGLVDGVTVASGRDD